MEREYITHPAQQMCTISPRTPLRSYSIGDNIDGKQRCLKSRFKNACTTDNSLERLSVQIRNCSQKFYHRD